MLVIENDLVRVAVNPLGAELSSLFKKPTSTEYIWQGGDPWNRRAPVLFPIVGRLKNDQYTWEGRQYKLSQHGFARDMAFDAEIFSDDLIICKLQPTTETRRVYPFEFEFEIRYELVMHTLYQTFIVRNNGESGMPVSFGAHPAFNIQPLTDFYLEFESTESVLSDTVVNGIRNGYTRNFIKNKQIQITPNLFDEDALIYSGLNSKSIQIKRKNNQHHLSIGFNGFTHLGIWAKPGAPFVCIEPWMGIADSENRHGDIENKEGITILKPGGYLERTMVLGV